MINSSALKGKLVECGITQDEMAKKIGVSSSTFQRHMSDGVFGSDEIESMAAVMKLDDREFMRIFFPAR